MLKRKGFTGFHKRWKGENELLVCDDTDDAYEVSHGPENNMH